MADSDCIAKLPKKIVTNILIRLPVKSIIRCECMSKQWSAFIKSPDFIVSHLSFSSRNATLILRHYNIFISECAGILLHGTYNETLDVSEAMLMNPSPSFPKIMGSCDGLICLDISPSYASDLVLWNPATRKFRHLPQPRIKNSWHKLDNEPWIVVIGFGFQEKAKDYKIVRIVFFEDPDAELPEIRIEIFSRNMGNWREIPVNLGSFVIHPCQQAAVVNGWLHWMGSGFGEYAGKKFVVCFDIEHEVFLLRKLPYSSDIFPEICMKVMEYQGSLCLFAYPNSPNFDRFELWMMEVGQNLTNTGWSLISKIGDFPRDLIPEAISLKSGKVVVKTLNRDRHGGGGLLFYDIICNDKDEIRILPDKIADCSFEVYKFIESLIPVTLQ